MSKPSEVRTDENVKPMIEVICGFISNSQNELFIARRAPHKEHAGYWEFPGGKLEPGENHQDCLKRELLEELGMRVTIHDFASKSLHSYAKYRVLLFAYHCQFLSACYECSDHDRYEWVPPNLLNNYHLAPSNLEFAKFLGTI